VEQMRRLPALLEAPGQRLDACLMAVRGRRDGDPEALARPCRSQVLGHPRSFRSTLLRRARTPILPGRRPKDILSVLPIETERLLIRELTESDVDGAHRVYGDPEAMRYVGADGKARTREESAAGVLRMMEGQRENGFSLWAVDLKERGEMIGVCGVVHVDGTGPDVELVYEFQRSAWGRGYATEAARACLAVALGPLGLGRVVALAYPENAQSIRIMQKLGMRDAGTVDAYGHELVCYEAFAEPTAGV
jgi:[ribosomal protein S5]-alanine N-acetyltransferase